MTLSKHKTLLGNLMLLALAKYGKRLFEMYNGPERHLLIAKFLVFWRQLKSEKLERALQMLSSRSAVSALDALTRQNATAQVAVPAAISANTDKLVVAASLKKDAATAALNQLYNYICTNFAGWSKRGLGVVLEYIYYLFVKVLEYKCVTGLIVALDLAQDSMRGYPVQQRRYFGQLVPLASNGWTRAFNPLYHRYIRSIEDIPVEATGDSFDEDGVNRHNAALEAHLQMAIEPIMHHGQPLIPVRLNGVNTLQPFTQYTEKKPAFEQAIADLVRKGATGDVVIIRGSANLGPSPLGVHRGMIKEESPCLNSNMVPVSDLGAVPLNQGTIGMEDNGAMIDLGQYFRIGPLFVMTGHTLQVCADLVKCNNTKLYFQAISERGPKGSGKWISVDRVVGHPTAKHGILAPGLSALATCEGTSIKYDDPRRKPFCVGANNYEVFPYGTHGGDIAVLFPTEYTLENKKLHYDQLKLEQVYGIMGLKKGKLVSDVKSGNVVIHSYCPAPSAPCNVPTNVLCRASGPFDFNSQTILDREVNHKRKRSDLEPIDSMLRCHGCSTISHKGVGEGTSGAMGSVIGNGGALGGPVLMQTGSYIGPQREAMGRMTNLCVPLYLPMKIIEDQTGLVLIDRNRSPAIKELMNAVPSLGRLVDAKRRRMIQVESPNGNRQTEYIRERENRWELEQEEEDRQRREAEAQDAAAERADNWAMEMMIDERRFVVHGDRYEEREQDFESEQERFHRHQRELMDEIIHAGDDEGAYADYRDLIAEVNARMHREDAQGYGPRAADRRRWADMSDDGWPESPGFNDLVQRLDDKGVLDINKLKAFEARILEKFDERSLDLKHEIYAGCLQMVKLIQKTLEDYKTDPLKMLTEGKMANYSGLPTSVLKALPMMDKEDAKRIIDLHHEAQPPSVKQESPALLNGEYHATEETEPTASGQEGFRDAATKGSVANAEGAEAEEQATEKKSKRRRRKPKAERLKWVACYVEKAPTQEVTEESPTTQDQ